MPRWNQQGPTERVWPDPKDNRAMQPPRRQTVLIPGTRGKCRLEIQLLQRVIAQMEQMCCEISLGKSSGVHLSEIQKQ